MTPTCWRSSGSRSAQAADLDQLNGPTLVSDAYGRAPTILRYLGRALADGSPAVAQLFDRARGGHGGSTCPSARAWTTRGAAPRSSSAMRLGVYALHGHLSRALGADAFTPQSLRRVSASLLEIVAPDFLGAAGPP